MELSILPTRATIGATVTGVSLATLGEHQWRAVEDAFHRFAVLIFPGQHLSDEAQVRFAKRFGVIVRLRPNTDVVSISNLREDGRVHESTAHRALVLRGNEGWHTDSSYMPLAARVSILSAKIVPREGGQTEWADASAGYDALDDETRDDIADRSAYHSLYHSQAKIGHEVKPNGEYGFHIEQPPLRPLVKTHPVTGRKALYIGRHAYGVTDLTERQSEVLLQRVEQLTCQAPRTFMHDWAPGDVVVWDNRSVLHRVRPYDFAEPRVMRHTRIAGDPKTELALNTTLQSNEAVLR